MKKKTPLLIVSLVIIVATVIGIVSYDKKDFEDVKASMDYIQYKGKNYVFNDNITTILFFGVDKDSEYLKDQEGVFVVTNIQQADFINILAYDNMTKELKVIKINRDSMFKAETVTDMSIDDYIQLALSHTYGTGGSDSAVNLMIATSSLFDNYISINNYVKIPYDIVGAASDAIGGVEIEVLQDMTSVDASLIRGEKLLLKGNLATEYVRSRTSLYDDTNKARMKRQTQFIQEFLRQYKKLESVSLDKFSNIANMIYSNVSIAQLQTIIDNADLDNITYYDIDGYNSMGTKYIEFNVDSDSALDVVFDVFYNLVD